jgi:Sec-independent protein secretion pathway component TatC
MKNQLLLLCLVYGLSGGLVYLNPTEPFKSLPGGRFCCWTFVASPFVFYQLWLFMAPGHGRRATAF